MKKALTTVALATILAFGSTFANAGIIILNSTTSTSPTPPCSDNASRSCVASSRSLDLTGIIILNLTGIIIL